MELSTVKGLAQFATHNLCDNLFRYTLLVAQDMCLNLLDVDCTKRVVDGSPRAWAHKASPSLNSPLSNLLSRNILCDSIVVHAGQNQLLAHEQTSWAWAPIQNKIRQTCLE